MTPSIGIRIRLDREMLSRWIYRNTASVPEVRAIVNRAQWPIVTETQILQPSFWPDRSFDEHSERIVVAGLLGAS